MQLSLKLFVIAGIFIFASLFFILANGSLVLWTTAKLLYGIGVLLFLFDR